MTEWFRLDEDWYRREVVDGVDGPWERSDAPSFLRLPPGVKVAGVTLSVNEATGSFDATWVEV